MRNGLTPYRHRGHVIDVEVEAARTGKSGEVILNHLSGSGQMPKGVWPKVHRFYENAISDMRLVTVLREPRSRLLSYYYYYVENPRKRRRHRPPSLEEWVAGPAVHHGLRAEFGLVDETDMKVFMEEYIGKFDFIVITDRMDESMIAMAYTLGWSVADVTYLRLLDSHTEAGSKTWDGRTIKQSPKVEDLPPSLQHSLAEAARPDQPLFDYANKRLDEILAGMGDQVEPLKRRFWELQHALAGMCGCDDATAEQRQFCEW